MENSRIITKLDDPGKKLESQFGNTTYRKWCELEAERIRSKGKKAFVVEIGEEVAIAL